MNKTSLFWAIIAGVSTMVVVAIVASIAISVWYYFGCCCGSGGTIRRRRERRQRERQNCDIQLAPTYQYSDPGLGNNDHEDAGNYYDEEQGMMMPHSAPNSAGNVEMTGVVAESDHSDSSVQVGTSKKVTTTGLDSKVVIPEWAKTAEVRTISTTKMDGEIPDLTRVLSEDSEVDGGRAHSGGSQAADIPNNLTKTTSKYLTINETIEKIRFIFPRFVFKWPNDQDYDSDHPGYGSTIRHMQDALKEYVTITTMNLQNKSPRDYSKLKTQDNGSAFYLALGMNIEFVKERFYFVRNAQEELGVIKGKTPPLVCLFYLIDSINATNPWGEVTGGQIVQRVEHTTYTVLENGQRVVTGTETLDLTRDWKNLRYMGVKAKKDNLKKSAKQAEESLKLAHPNYESLFMHGTTGVGLEKIFQNRKMHPSLTRSEDNLEHDLGQGVYCFRGKMLWALSFAFDRCWPFKTTLVEEGGERKLKPAAGAGSNPSIVVFLNPRSTDNNIYDVHSKLPFGDDGTEGGEDGNGLQDFSELKTQRYQNYMKEYRESQNDDVDEFRRRNPGYTEEAMLNWLLFVKMVRAERLEWEPDGKVIIKGLLHDCSRTHEADKEGKGHPPIPDMDGWVQYCFRNHLDLGRNFLFLEFHVDWDEWKRGKENWKREGEWEADKKMVESICTYDRNFGCYIL